VELLADESHVEATANALQAIAHPVRLQILCILSNGPTCVQDIVEALGASNQSGISQHLAHMRRAGIVKTRKDWNRVYYRLTDPRILRLILALRDIFCGSHGADRKKGRRT